jgi:KaiC domain protein
MRENAPLSDALLTLRQISASAPRLEGVPSGVEGLDELFYTTSWQDGRALVRPLGGLPRYGVLQVTGVADTGKSLLVEQFALERTRRGESVLFLTTESPAPFVAMTLRARAEAMGIDWEAVQDRIVFLDAASHTVLMHDIPTLLRTMAQGIKSYRVRATVIDSITGLYEAREMMARDVVRSLYEWLKKWHQTALLVSQKRSGHELLTAEAAGGYAVGHILDGTLVLAKVLVLSPQQARLYRVPLGEIVRLFRIDGCRLCGHDTATHLLEITPTGLVRIGPRLEAWQQGGDREDA